MIVDIPIFVKNRGGGAMGTRRSQIQGKRKGEGPRKKMLCKTTTRWFNADPIVPTRRETY